MYAIFSYGTFRDTDIQTALFGHDIPMQKAILQGWALCVNDLGYFYAVESKNEFISGKILYLEESELFTADRWEEIPLYRRILITVGLDNGESEEAWMYVQPTLFSRETAAVVPNSFSAHNKSDDLHEAQSFFDQLQNHHLPLSDVYIHIPCTVVPSTMRENIIDPSLYIETLNNTSKDEFSSRISTSLKRGCLGFAELVIKSPVLDKSLNYSHKAPVYLTIHEPSQLAVVTLALPLCRIPVDFLLDRVSEEDVRVKSENDTETWISLTSWLSDRGIEQQSFARTSVFVSGSLDKQLLMSLLAGEYVQETSSFSNHLIEKRIKNIAQYVTAEIYVSEHCVVEIPLKFKTLWEDRLIGQSLTIFVIELLLFQIGAISNANNRIAEELDKQNIFSYRDALGWIENLSSTFSRAMIFWDIRSFKFATAQYLADEIAEHFNLAHQIKVYESNKALLEQLIALHSTRIQEKENKNVNFLLMFLAALQVIPIIYEASFSLTSGWKDVHIKPIISSLIIWFLIWAVFLYRQKKSSPMKQWIKKILMNKPTS